MESPASSGTSRRIITSISTWPASTSKPFGRGSQTVAGRNRAGSGGEVRTPAVRSQHRSAGVARTFLTRRESPTDPPNYFLRTLAKTTLAETPEGEASWTSTSQAITRFPDPAPQLRGITKRLVSYVRADGVSLSFTLHLPPDYKPGTRLPTVLYA